MSVAADATISGNTNEMSPYCVALRPDAHASRDFDDRQASQSLEFF
jgi:hypothetical protein